MLVPVRVKIDFGRCSGFGLGGEFVLGNLRSQYFESLFHKSRWYHQPELKTTQSGVFVREVGRNRRASQQPACQACFLGHCEGGYRDRFITGTRLFGSRIYRGDPDGRGRFGV